jgi:hypothetical protein
MGWLRCAGYYWDIYREAVAVRRYFAIPVREYGTLDLLDRGFDQVRKHASAFHGAFDTFCVEAQSLFFRSIIWNYPIGQYINRRFTKERSLCTECLRVQEILHLVFFCVN